MSWSCLGEAGTHYASITAGSPKCLWLGIHRLIIPTRETSLSHHQRRWLLARRPLCSRLKSGWDSGSNSGLAVLEAVIGRIETPRSIH